MRYILPGAGIRLVPQSEDALLPDAFLHKGGGGDHILNIDELPLLWIAGSVTGKHPDASNLRQSENAERFKVVRGDTIANRECAVLSVGEQQSDKMVRELWVDRKPPHTIYRAHAKIGDSIYWQINAKYRMIGDSQQILNSWTVTSYKLGTKQAALIKTYDIDKLRIDNILAASLFDQSFKPGMIVYDVSKNAPFRVSGDGGLIPYVKPKPTPPPQP